ncbi:MAG: prepilin-type N-terminal cleavage/methylation domain-containing protein [Candidatus Moraniibacteriota bacterium]
MMKKQNRQRQRAFTLIEILIVIAIITIFATVILIDSSQGRVRRETENAGREMESAMRVAQNYALTGRKVVDDAIPTTALPCYFMVRWDGGLSSYAITYIYKNTSSDACSPSGPSFVLATYALKSGVTFNTTGSFYFSLPHANIFDGSGAITTSKGVIMEKVGIRQIACIYAGGRIERASGSTCP